MAYYKIIYDNSLLLMPSSTITTTTTGTLIVNVGTGFVKGNWVIDINSVSTVVGTELYHFYLEGATNAIMTTGNVILSNAYMGNNVAPMLADTTPGRFVLPFTNEQNNTLCQYIRLYLTVSGASPSITFSSFLSLD